MTDEEQEASEYEGTKELAEGVQLLLIQGIAAIERLCAIGESLTNMVSKLERLEALRKSTDKSFFRKLAADAEKEREDAVA